MTRISMLHVLCAAFFAAFLSGCASDVAITRSADASPTRYDLLRDGGYVLVMRHAHSPHGQSEPERIGADCRLGDGRGLSATGARQARFIGDVIAAENIPLLKAYTSRMCRSWDTAILAAGAAPVIPHDSQMTTNPDAIAAFKKEIEAELAASPGINIMLVSHSNIAPLYGARKNQDEDEIPEGVAFIVIPGEWVSIGRFGREKEKEPSFSQLD